MESDSGYTESGSSYRESPDSRMSDGRGSSPSPIGETRREKSSSLPLRAGLRSIHPCKSYREGDGREPIEMSRVGL